MENFIRLSGIINRVSAANPTDCLEEIKQTLSELPHGGSDIVVLPKLALCSPSCGSLFMNGALTGQCEEALRDLCSFTHNMDSYILAGTVINDWGKTVSAMAILHRGEVLALIPTTDNMNPLANEGYSERFLPTDTVFSCGDIRFCVLGCGLPSLALSCAEISKTGCDLIIIPAYDPIYAGMIDEVCAHAKAISSSTGCAVTVCNGGIGDTSFPYIYKGFAAIYECGVELGRIEAENVSVQITVDIDPDIITSQKKSTSCIKPFHSINPVNPKSGLIRTIDKNPFLPCENTERYLEELFDLQARSLASRMENIGCSKIVLGVSGGLDSTAALLVGIRAADILGLPRKNIVGITMPGFGTSDHTYYNALDLLDKLEVSRLDISIKAAVQQHFEDIGHGGHRDTVYENAQARERTQILLDIANMYSGIMIGSGDLSEEALGFSTFAGDQIAGYNINCCITKTTLRDLISHIADIDMFPAVSDTLRGILDTPISPELLPPGEAGEIRQKTEEILGPYILHDFFLYYFVKYRMRPSKIYYYACTAFSGEIPPEYIRDKLKFFIQRFCAGQFKRSCAPDAASITEVNLCGVNFYIPSDLDPAMLISELDVYISS